MVCGFWLVKEDEDVEAACVEVAVGGAGGTGGGGEGRKGNRNVARWKVERARALLLCGEGEGGPKWSDGECAVAVGATEQTVARWRSKAVEDGPLAALERKPRLTPPRARSLDGEGEAWLAKLACSEAPDGRSRWTLRLLAERLVELEVVESISHETVRRTLKKRFEAVAPRDVVRSAEGRRAVRGADGGASYVYGKPRDPLRPVVCMDEQPKQLVSETRVPIPMSPGAVKRVDHEYAREGVCTVWMFVEPLGAWRDVRVTERRTATDWAAQVRRLVDDPRHAGAERITLVCDNLNTHDIGSLYDAFPAEEARRVARRLDMVFTPAHGS